MNATMQKIQITNKYLRKKLEKKKKMMMKISKKTSKEVSKRGSIARHTKELKTRTRKGRSTTAKGSQMQIRSSFAKPTQT